MTAQPKSKRGDKRVKARVMYLGSSCAVIPCATLKHARALVKFAEMTEERKVERVAMASDTYFDSINGNHEAFKAYDHARAVLRSLGLMEEGK